MLGIILAVIVFAMDMVSKHLAALYCQTPVVIIDGVVRLTYVENTGAAWGILSGATIVLSIVAALFCVFLAWMYIRNYKKMTKLSKIITGLMFAGALGNLIDRIIFGYVRDMIEVTFISFPVFNIADSAMVIGMILLVVEVFFIKKNLFSVVEDDLKSFRKRKTDERTDNH